MMYDFFGEVLVKVFAYFQNRIVYFLILSFKSSSYILDSGPNGNPLQYSCLVNPMDGGAW